MKKIRNVVLMGAVLLLAIIFTAACAKKVDEIEKKQTNENTMEDDVKGIPSAARYQIVEALKKELKETYKDKYTEVKFDVTKIYSDDEAKDLVDNYSDKDIVFEVEYQIKPTEGVDPNEFMIPNGELDSETGWVKKIKRVGSLRYNSKDGSYSLSNFGTGF